MTKPSCPLAIQRARGIYANASTTTSSSYLQNTVLVTAANLEFGTLLKNWQYFAEHRHGFKYAVLALDDALYQSLGPDLCVPSAPEF